MVTRRQTWRGRETLLPQLKMVGWHAARSTVGHGLGAHDHGDCYEICLIVRGQVDWWVENESHRVGGGQVFLTRPFERHGGIDAALGACELTWLVTAIPARTGWGAMTRREAGRLRRDLEALVRRRFDADRPLIQAFESLLAAHRSAQPTRAIEAKAALSMLLVGLLRCHGRAVEAAGTGPSEAIRLAADWMRQHLAEPIDIADVAAVAGLSVARFHERFATEMGIPPGDWRQRRRVDRARSLLRRTDRSITDIAHACGFASGQYFATCFKQHTGRTPSAYRDESGRSG